MHLDWRKLETTSVSAWISSFGWIFNFWKWWRCSSCVKSLPTISNLPILRQRDVWNKICMNRIFSKQDESFEKQNLEYQKLVWLKLCMNFACCLWYKSVTRDWNIRHPRLSSPVITVARYWKYSSFVTLVARDYRRSWPPSPATKISVTRNSRRPCSLSHVTWNIRHPRLQSPRMWGWLGCTTAWIFR